MKWEDKYEDYTRNGESQVLDVYETADGVVKCIAVKHGSGKIISVLGGSHMLVPKKKTTKYRPWKPAEVPVGEVVTVNDGSGLRFLIIGASVHEIFIGKVSYLPDEAMRNFLREDGSTCGILE